MIDEMFDRAYQSARQSMNRDATLAGANVLKLVGDAFKVLNRIEYSAPWTKPAKRARFN